MLSLTAASALFAAVAAATVTPLTAATAAAISNPTVFIDMVQNNPGDPVAWQQTKYFDPRVLAHLNYTGQTTTGEMSGTQAVDFRTLGGGSGEGDYFPAGSAARRWLDAYAAGVHAFVDRAVAAGIEPYFFVDLLVFPSAVLAAWPNATDPASGRVVWNAATRQLTAALVRETFAEFPHLKGWIVRTGETYTYDTPYHVGNSPTANGNNTQDMWVDFISFLRDEVCDKADRHLLMRSWDNWPSSAAYYEQMTDRIAPHDNLYFSVKHSAADFTRPAQWNPTLGVGQHAQVVEVELQREYEGKQSYPNYVVDGVVDGFKEMGDHKIGITSLLGKPQLKGLWTWTRGGGWWGPYLHGNEWGVDLHASTVAYWWNGNSNSTNANKAATGTTEPQAFMQACEDLFEGCTAANGCCAAMRTFVQAGADSVLHGQWGTISSPGDWMRDDRIGGLNKTRGHFKAVAGDPQKLAQSLAEKAFAASNFAALAAEDGVWATSIAPHLADSMQRDRIAASLQYGVLLYAVVAPAWRAMAQGYLHESGSVAFNTSALQEAIVDYDAAWASYRAFGLANVLAPSLYHDYYLCLGTECNCAFDPEDPGDEGFGRGIGVTIDMLRNVSTVDVPSSSLFARRPK